jgi:hypothetical protein
MNPTERWSVADDMFQLHIESLQSQRRDSYRRVRLANEGRSTASLAERRLRAERAYDMETDRLRGVIAANRALKGATA